MASDDEASNHEPIHEDSLTNKPAEKDPATDPRNPYYVHPDENLGAILVTPSLDDNNYHNRSRSMHRAFTSKNKVVFINRTLNKPSKTLILNSGIMLTTWYYPGSTTLFHLTLLKAPFALILYLIFGKICVKDLQKGTIFDSLIFFVISTQSNKVIKPPSNTLMNSKLYGTNLKIYA